MKSWVFLMKDNSLSCIPIRWSICLCRSSSLSLPIIVETENWLLNKQKSAKSIQSIKRLDNMSRFRGSKAAELLSSHRVGIKGLQAWDPLEFLQNLARFEVDCRFPRYPFYNGSNTLQSSIQFSLSGPYGVPWSNLVLSSYTLKQSLLKLRNNISMNG